MAALPPPSHPPGSFRPWNPVSWITDFPSGLNTHHSCSGARQAPFLIPIRPTNHHSSLLASVQSHQEVLKEVGQTGVHSSCDFLDQSPGPAVTASVLHPSFALRPPLHPAGSFSASLLYISPLSISLIHKSSGSVQEISCSSLSMFTAPSGKGGREAWWLRSAPNSSGDPGN